MNKHKKTNKIKMKDSTPKTDGRTDRFNVNPKAGSIVRKRLESFHASFSIKLVVAADTARSSLSFKE